MSADPGITPAQENGINLWYTGRVLGFATANSRLSSSAGIYQANWSIGFYDVLIMCRLWHWLVLGRSLYHVSICALLSVSH